VLRKRVEKGNRVHTKQKLL